LAVLLVKADEDLFKKVEKEKDEQGHAHIFESEDEKKRYDIIKKQRGSAKVINFSATYGAGPAKIAATLKCTIEFATILHETYWKRNAAVKKTAKACVVKTVRGQKWLYNPVSKLWMFLKAEKDRFSTLNQSTGVFVFDSWLRKVRERLNPLGIKISLQYHDELLLKCKKEHKDIVEFHLKDAMASLNKELGLNVSIGNSVDWGINYGQVH
jgi:DNA polymerase I-like protein with 3'-5' exonuclease and polymerase domains